MRRLIVAFQNSRRALNTLARDEPAIRLELILCFLAVPVSFIIAQNTASALLMIAAVVLLFLVEVINSAIEAACDAITTQFDQNIQLAKDCGSLAVLIATILAAGVWIYVIAGRVLTLIMF